MAIPPKWKIRRELWRIREQFIGAVSPIKDVPRRFYYDAFMAKRLNPVVGNLELSDRLAVVVLFQPEGLSQSTRLTFDYLIAHGWTPLAISNAALSPDDVAMLRPRTARILVRPNIGYDFGAYRDGIHVIAGLELEPKRLILMNDSTWFPLRETDRTLERIEGLNADVAGHILKVEDNKAKGQTHIESHFLMFSSAIISSEHFRSFWVNYVMSDNRDVTIASGEKGVGRMALENGYTLDALLTPSKLLAHLATTSLVQYWALSIRCVLRARLRGCFCQGGICARVSYIATLVERHSRFVMLAKVANKDTQSVITALIKQARKLPKELYRSLTWDRGSEMTGHVKFTEATKIDVFFCDPQSPWQRGSNENTNRLLRQYFPRGIDMSAYSQAKLSAVARQLNERPRKTLQYQTPAEKFEACVAAIN